MNKQQKKSDGLLKFARRYPSWHHYSHDRDTVEILCALTNDNKLELKSDMYIITQKGVDHCKLYFERK